MFKTLLFLTFIFTNVVSASEQSKYTSVIVIGHLYPLYDNLGREDKLANLDVLFNKISKINNMEKIILLGDTYSEDLDNVYSFVNTEIIPRFKVPILKVLGNHEVAEIFYKFSRAPVNRGGGRFKLEGGIAKGLFDLNKYRFLIYSPWRFIDGKPKRVILSDDVKFFERNLNPINNIILVTDALYHPNLSLPKWRKKIEPLLDSSYVIIGDNDIFQHQYSMERTENNITYINQGIASGNLSNRSTILEIRLFENKEVQFIPHFLKFNKNFRM